ncbi:hypothetical protein PY365_03630 [Roseiarcaceae bacterium H3SJ34-1]|uniref:hypothetical protein n=1 Tax=Terripilifer ovatus TaxID=3032367 RepID=UPI003AB98D1F|nr:hypothetical protein [Roseiarcaceae bacterium H3SJ34-1]
MTVDLVDKIYEATILPDLWPDVIHGLGKISGSVSGALLAFDGTVPVDSRATEFWFDTLEIFAQPMPSKRARE